MLLTDIAHEGTHQDNMSVSYLPPCTQFLYSKTGLCRGKPIFLIFAPKHRLWVPVRIRKISKKIPLKIFNFYNLEKSVYYMSVCNAVLPLGHQASI